MNKHVGLSISSVSTLRNGKHTFFFSDLYRLADTIIPQRNCRNPKPEPLEPFRTETGGNVKGTSIEEGEGSETFLERECVLRTFPGASWESFFCEFSVLSTKTCLKQKKTFLERICFLTPLSHPWEPPDVGLAPTGVWRVPPPPPLQLEGPSLKPRPFPPRRLPPSSPHPPLALFAMFRDGAAQSGVGGRGPRVQGGWRGGARQRYLGPDPHLGGTRNPL